MGATMKDQLDPAPLRSAIAQDALSARVNCDAYFSCERTGVKTPGLNILARNIGWPERTFWRVINEVTYVTEDLVDRYCIATGRHIFDLYPDLRDRIDREQADQWLVARMRACGMGLKDIASTLSVAPHQASAIHRSWRCLNPPEELIFRCCSNHACPRSGTEYPVPHPDIVKLAPILDACPWCDAVGARRERRADAA